MPFFNSMFPDPNQIQQPWNQGPGQGGGGVTGVGGNGGGYATPSGFPGPPPIGGGGINSVPGGNSGGSGVLSGSLGGQIPQLPPIFEQGRNVPVGVPGAGTLPGGFNPYTGNRRIAPPVNPPPIPQPPIIPPRSIAPSPVNSGSLRPNPNPGGQVIDRPPTNDGSGGKPIARPSPLGGGINPGGGMKGMPQRKPIIRPSLGGVRPMNRFGTSQY